MSNLILFVPSKQSEYQLFASVYTFFFQFIKKSKISNTVFFFVKHDLERKCSISLVTPLPNNVFKRLVGEMVHHNKVYLKYVSKKLQAPSTVQ